MQVVEYKFEETHKMHGIKRVIIFCILIVLLPIALIIVPLYLRKTIFADVTYSVAESDIIEIRDGISSIFCQQHSLRMNSNFNAFQVRSKPEISTSRKHIRLKKSMTLPDDTLEYWGFYLLKGALVQLKFCSRYDGSRILVVKGQRNLKTCGLLDHNKNKVGANFAQGHDKVKVFFEDITEISEHIPMQGINKSLLTYNLSNTKVEDNVSEFENHAEEENEDDFTNQNIRHLNMLNANIFAMNLNEERVRSSYNSNTNESQYQKQFYTKNVTLNNNINKKLISERELLVRTNINRKRRHHNHQSSENKLPGTYGKSLKKNYKNEKEKKILYDRLYKYRIKREHVYDRKYSHGGNAVNFTEADESNSISSFENGLFDCYNGAILLAEGFPPSSECLSTHFLENGSHRMISKHEVNEDGYYYYIFYSDNDLVRNDIHAIFDIYKPTFQYSNLTDAQECVNATSCIFSIGFLSDEVVVVEVPTRDGIEHEEDDVTYLISTCHPRTEVYAIFPIIVLILVLSCSFL